MSGLDRSARYPVIYQVNARVFLRSITAEIGRQAGFDDIDDARLATLIPPAITWIWFLGVWSTGTAGRDISRTDPTLRAGLADTLPDLVDDDIVGSCFAITGYVVPEAFGGDAALARLRARLAARGVRLMLDFVPNHTALDHPWVRAEPDLFVCGDEATLAADPVNWRRVATDEGDTVIALGRDPYFSGWPDTFQLDYANPETQARMGAILAGLASLCDGVRVDMAMLVLPEVIRRTWRHEAPEFWPDAIAGSRRIDPDFELMAEVYWGLEGALIERGFDLTYDKGFYDALVQADCGQLRGRLAEPVHEQAHMVRFLENHDEARAATAFAPAMLRAATIIGLLAPGTRLIEHGQLDGARIHVSMHLGRGPDETPDPEIARFHHRLLTRVLARPAVQGGEFSVLEPEPAWEGNPSHQRFIAFVWCGESDDGHAGALAEILVVVNYGPDQGQCRINFDRLSGDWTLDDLMGNEHYARSGAEMSSPGLFLDLAGWGYNVFEMTRTSD